jgi:hypothetical protein
MVELQQSLGVLKIFLGIFLFGFIAIVVYVSKKWMPFPQGKETEVLSKKSTKVVKKGLFKYEYSFEFAARDSLSQQTAAIIIRCSGAPRIRFFNRSRIRLRVNKEDVDTACLLNAAGDMSFQGKLKEHLIQKSNKLIFSCCWKSLRDFKISLIEECNKKYTQ